jgi:tripartite-type tricarboxylate transporter receptor subunit TctC
VRIIVPFAPDGSTDITARLIGQWLSERLGQQFVIENRPGAGSNIGTEAVVKAPPDGYTLLLVGASSAINVTLYENLNFNFLSDITPVAGMIASIVTFRLLRRRAYAPHINAETVERGACKNKESHERGKGGELKSHSRALILGAYGRFGSGGSLSFRSTNNSAAASAL